MPIYVSLGNTPEKISALYYAGLTNKAKKGGAKICVKVVPDNSYHLQLYCKAFERSTGLSLPYYGDGMPSVTLRSLQELFITQRASLDTAGRRNLVQSQGNCCNRCKVRLKSRGGVLQKYEIDHILSLGSYFWESNSNGA